MYVLTEIVTHYRGMPPEFLLRKVRNLVDDNNKFGLPFWAAADCKGGKTVVTRSVVVGVTVQAASAATAATKADPLTNHEFTAAKKRLLGTRSSRGAGPLLLTLAIDRAVGRVSRCSGLAVPPIWRSIYLSKRGKFGAVWRKCIRGGQNFPVISGQS